MFCDELKIQYYTRVYRSVDRLVEDLVKWQEHD
jgi:hypothetical protein